MGFPYESPISEFEWDGLVTQNGRKTRICGGDLGGEIRNLVLN